MSTFDPNGQTGLLHQLHRSLFVMPTVWDALSALAAVEAGHQAVATSSAALGQALGIKASERVAFDQLETQIRHIASAVRAPIVIDLEDGYPEVPGGVESAIQRIVAAGAAGANIEDSRGGHAQPLASADDHARRIETARRAADAVLPGFFLNGRTDLFLQHPGVEPEVSVREAIRRARLYAQAGADGIYVAAGRLSDEQVAELVAGIPLPLTLVAREGQNLNTWRDIGVRRASLGTLLIRAAFDAVRGQLQRTHEAAVIAAAPAIDIDAAIERNRLPTAAAATASLA